MTRLEEEWQEEERPLEESIVEEPPSSQDDQFETSEVDERVNVTIDGVEIKAVVEVEAAEREKVETTEAGNVILCCFAAFLIHLYYFDL